MSILLLVCMDLYKSALWAHSMYRALLFWIEFPMLTLSVSRAYFVSWVLSSPLNLFLCSVFCFLSIFSTLYFTVCLTRSTWAGKYCTLCSWLRNRPRRPRWNRLCKAPTCGIVWYKGPGRPSLLFRDRSDPHPTNQPTALRVEYALQVRDGRL